MYLYIELWKPKEAWLKLTREERKAKIDELLQEAKTHPITGVIPFSFKQVGDVFLLDGVTEQPVVIDSAVARPTGYRYAAAWMIPTRELISKFEKRVENLGWWFDYFEQKNAWGEMNREATVADMLGTQVPSSSGTSPGAAARSGLGRFGRAEVAATKLRDDVDELKKGVNVVVDYVNSEKSRK